MSQSASQFLMDFRIFTVSATNKSELASRNEGELS